MKKIINKIKKYKETHSFKETISWLYNGVVFRIKRKRIKSSDFKEVNIPDNEKAYLIPKSGPNIFIVASIPYYDIGGGQRCSSLARTFNKMGYNVIYLYAYKSAELTKINIEMPFSAHLFIDDKTLTYIESIVKENDLFIIEAPSKKFARVIDLAIDKKGKIVYENIDNWETSLGADVYNEEVLIKLLSNASVVVGTAKPLVKQLEGYFKKYNIPSKEVLYLPNAVDEELFCGLKNLTKPSDMALGDKTFTYYGSLWGSWFDWDLIINLAKNNPTYSINLIGEASNIKDIINKCPDNIHFLGLKKQSELPSYLKYTDYALIPFKPGEIGDYVSPLKVFEYISMYTKVLATRLPDIEGYPNVYLGNTIDDWEKYIKENNKVDTILADDFIENNTWTSRVEKIIAKVYPEESKSILKDKISIIILNYNNKNIIFKSLNTLIKYNELYNYEIIVVDNGSTDGSYEKLKDEYEGKITLLKNAKNGCSSGRNLGASHAKNEYLLFLDSDQWATNKYFLRGYEKLLEQDSNLVIGWAAGFFANNGYAYRTVDNFPYRFMPSLVLGRKDISYLGSGGMLMKKEVFKAIKGFDEKYDPTCYEDTDISLKVQNYGKEIVYCPYLGIIHLPHQTTNDGSDAHLKLNDERKKYFKQKWEKENPDLLKKFIK